MRFLSHAARIMALSFVMLTGWPAIDCVASTMSCAYLINKSLNIGVTYHMKSPHIYYILQLYLSSIGVIVHL